MLLVPGPALASTTWAQWRIEPLGSFFHLLTKRTHALHISPILVWSSWKHCKKSSSYFLLSVNQELLDLALQIQHPAGDLYILGLWKEDIVICLFYQFHHEMKSFFWWQHCFYIDVLLGWYFWVFQTITLDHGLFELWRLMSGLCWCTLWPGDRASFAFVLFKIVHLSFDSIYRVGPGFKSCTI